VQHVREHHSDTILAIGGGSVIDAAKVIGAMALTGKSPQQLVGMLKVRRPMMPFYACRRRAGTGSEVTVAAVMTDPVRHREGCRDRPEARARRCGARSTAHEGGMPKSITAATGMDALTHAVAGLPEPMAARRYCEAMPSPLCG
jgi:alcohol dehydrogenase